MIYAMTYLEWHKKFLDWYAYAPYVKQKNKEWLASQPRVYPNPWSHLLFIYGEEALYLWCYNPYV